MKDALKENKETSHMYYLPKNTIRKMVDFAKVDIFIDQEINMKVIKRMQDQSKKVFKTFPKCIQNDIKVKMNEVWNMDKNRLELLCRLEIENKRKSIEHTKDIIEINNKEIKDDTKGVF